MSKISILTVREFAILVMIFYGVMNSPVKSLYVLGLYPKQVTAILCHSNGYLVRGPKFVVRFCREQVVV